MCPASPQYWLVGDIEEPTHLSQRVGTVAPSVVVCSSVNRWLIFRVLYCVLSLPQICQIRNLIKVK